MFASHVGGIEGGGERSLLETVCALAATGDVDPIVTVPENGPMRGRLAELGIRSDIVDSGLWVRLSAETPDRRWRWRMLGAQAKAIRDWCGFLRRVRPDVVVSQTATIVAPAAASRMLRVPHVWSIGEYLTPAHGLSFFVGARLSRRTIALLSGAVVARSEALRAHLSPPVPLGRVHVIAPVLAIPPVAPNAVDGDGLRLLVLGRHTPGKSVDVAIDAVAAASTPTVRLRIVGPLSDDDRVALEGRAREQGVADRVEVYGYTAHPEREIEWCNVMVLCSVDEGFGRVAGEALASGRPVIGARSGGTAELVDDEVNGVLVPPRDVPALAAAIDRLAADPEEVVRMSEAARHAAGARFSAAGHAAGYLDVLRSVLPAADAGDG